MLVARPPSMFPGYLTFEGSQRPWNLVRRRRQNTGPHDARNPDYSHQNVLGTPAYRRNSRPC
jgi:hypothetical protein